MITMEKQTEYLTAKQVAELLETPYTTVLDWIKAKKLTSYRFGGRIKVKRTDLEKFIEESKQ